MNILFTGNLTLISEELFLSVSDDYRCVVYQEDEKKKLTGKNIVVYQKYGDRQAYSKVFAAYGFETVVYFSYTLEGAAEAFQELEQLERTLHLVRQHKVKNFIYITGNDRDSDDGALRESESSVAVLRNACERLCRLVSAQTQTAVNILKIPYLYQMDGSGTCRLSALLKQAAQQKQIVFPGPGSFETDFLSLQDLGSLLDRMFDEPALESCRIMYLSGENAITFAELGAYFSAHFKGCEITYSQQEDGLCVCRKDDSARTLYGWYPKHLFADDINELAVRYSEKKKEPCHFLSAKWKTKQHLERIRKIFEVIALFFAAELLNYWTKDNVLIRFIDFRLVYIVIMGMMNGLSAGVASALLSCAGYLLSNISGTQWQIIFYNVQNWLPFACYFLLGAISGYTQDKHANEIVYNKEEYSLLEKKYQFLSGLYGQVLESKEHFNSQIIGYRDSFGQLYKIVKKLDSTLPEEVFYEAVSVLEEILGNYSVAIYTIDKAGFFARLNVCSKNAGSEFGKSMRLGEYPELLLALTENTTYVNTDGDKSCPAYATPLMREGELLGMILLTQANYQQMNMEFSNKFKIVTDLIRDSLIRAMGSFARSENSIEGTAILNAEKFREILSVKQQMRQKQYLDYTLLKLECGDRTLEELEETVRTVVRNNDILGQGADGRIYLLLSQTNLEELAVVAERMKIKQISFEVVAG